MESFLKRLSFFLIYLPALIFACQFAYYSGLCEPLDFRIASLGLNYSEVSFLGYLNTSILFLQTFNQTALYILYIVIFLLIAFTLHIFSIHPSERKNETYKIEAKIYQLKFNIPQWKFCLSRFFNTFLGLLLVYLTIFILTITLILHFYAKGKKDLFSAYKKIQESAECSYKDGYVLINNNLLRTQPILCGNLKCYGIDLDTNMIITYLPENYSRPLFLSKSVEKELSKKQ